MSLDLFQERLANARREKGMTQAELAGKLGVTAQAVSKWERGGAYPDIELLDGISSVLDCSLDYLFQYEEGVKSSGKQDSLVRRAELEALMLKDSITVLFGYGLVDLFLEEGKNKYASLHEMRKNMAGKYGFCVPTVRLADHTLCKPQEYKILFYGKEVASGIVYPSKCFVVNGKAEDEEDIAVIEPAWNLPGVWTDKTEEGCSPIRFIMIHLERCIINHLPDIFHCQMAADMVENVGKKYPKVVEGIIPERVSYSFLKRVLLILLCEKKYAVNHMVRIIEVLDEIADERPTAEKAAEHVAAALGESYRYDR